MMPLGIGKYSQHNKLSTEALDDEDEDKCNWNKNQFSSKNYIVTYLGEQNIPIFLSNDVSTIIDKVYNDNYSSIGKFIHLKKFTLVVDGRGISVIQPATRKQTASLILQYKLWDLLFITAHEKHEKVLAIVLKSSPSKAVVHVYLCGNDEEPKSFVEDCLEEFQRQEQMKEIKTNSFPDSIQLNFKNNTLKDLPVEKLVVKNNSELNITRTSAGTNQVITELITIKTPAGNIQPLAELSTTMTPTGNNQAMNQHTKKSIHQKDVFNQNGNFKAIGENNCNAGGTDLLRNDSLDDEFAQLALKRNKLQPDHLQDKSIESAMLMQEENTDEDGSETNAKYGFFSQYNRL